MPQIQCLQTGLIYRNPKPHVRSVHAMFPSIAVLENGEMLSTFVLGEAFEAANCRTHLARSVDCGGTWEIQGPIYDDTSDRVTSDSARLTALLNGGTIAFMVRHDRSDYLDEGLVNHRTLGFVPTELLLLRSHDGGRSWSEPQTISPPLVGPAFELCAPIMPLRDGRWVLATSTWRGWDGYCPNGMKMIALVSHDNGQSWPEYWDVMVDPEQNIFYWESKIIELKDSRLLAVAWAHNERTSRDLPNQYALSSDGGKTWTAPRSTELQGQTLTPFALDDGRVLCVYRRLDEPGLWANISSLEDEDWVNESAAPLWGAKVHGLVSTSENMAHNFNVLRFGAPSIAPSPDGTIFVAFWCYEDCVSNIRWFKLRID